GGPDDPDRLDLLVAGRGEDDVEGALFFSLLSSAIATCAAAGCGNGRRHCGRRDTELLLERFDPLGELEHRDALELLDPLLRACCHSLVLLGGIRIGRFGLRLSRSARLVVVCVLRLCVRPSLLPGRRRLADLPPPPA